jgi:protein-S-isoprenylcysteine O-methyltransferase Ste14
VLLENQRRSVAPKAMPDFPLLLLTATITAYWLGVGVMVVRVRRKTHRIVGLVPEQRVERLMWLVWVPLVAAWIALPYLALTKTGEPWALPVLATREPALVLLRWTAALVAVLCLASTAKCWARMGKDWRMDVGVATKTELITDGPFRRIRHPIYAFSILLMLCSATIVPTVPMLAVAAVHVALMILKARNEERHLLASHGETYERYVRRTGRFLPRSGAPGS